MSAPGEKTTTVAKANFAKTHWSVVLAAADVDSPRTDEAMEDLCRTYWYPLYAFVRRRGYPVDEAQDLTQSFFARLLDKNYLKSVDPGKGKFRSFLLAALEHFLANEWRRASAQKRGGGRTIISFDDDSAEKAYLEVPGIGLTPSQLYEQQWAAALLDSVLARLRSEYASANKAESFDELKIFLTGEKHLETYAMLADKVGTTEAALKMSISRLRRRYGQLLREEIAHTVSRPEEVEEELRGLAAALSR
jgi:RNA polymerase sigma-70 factor (ECF subfamily)